MVLIGLGNPGTRYDWTPHNIGFQVVDAVAKKRRADWEESPRGFLLARTSIRSTRVTLIKPTTYVNRSGEALRLLRKSLEFEASDVLVVVDDIALPFGQLRLRKRGSDGGHNGLRSIIDELGTTHFARLRMGVGRGEDGQDSADFVLAPFPEEQRDAVRQFVDRAVDCVYDVFSGGIDRAMSLHNATDRESD